MTNLRDIIPQVAVSIETKTVTIELICSDAYAARVLFEDVVEKAQSPGGLRLRLRGTIKADSGAGS